ncbi:MAG: hypothetical protein QW145_01400 [Candidatus Bathyarchaeia archaeon]
MGYEVAARSSEESIAANLLGLRNRQLVLETRRARRISYTVEP